LPHDRDGGKDNEQPYTGDQNFEYNNEFLRIYPIRRLRALDFPPVTIGINIPESKPTLQLKAFAVSLWKFV
jgi:hypothetical protein